MKPKRELDKKDYTNPTKDDLYGIMIDADGPEDTTILFVVRDLTNVTPTKEDLSGIMVSR